MVNTKIYYYQYKYKYTLLCIYTINILTKETESFKCNLVHYIFVCHN